MRPLRVFALGALLAPGCALRGATRLLAVEGGAARPNFRYPTPEELTPRSDAMLARAAACQAAFPHRFVSPAEAAEMVRVGAALCDVRTEDQAADHEVGGVAGRTARGARRLALDNMCIAGAPPPMLGGGGRKVVLACTGGPKSAIGVEFLLEFGIDAYAVQGGLDAWHDAGLDLVGVDDADD